MANVGLMFLGFSALLGICAFALASFREGERRAARIALGAAGVTSLPFFGAIFLPSQAKTFVFGGTIALLAVAAIFFLLPIGRVLRVSDDPRRRFDERDTMFARARLIPGSTSYDAYYALRPENKAGDDRSRALPGLLAAGGSEANSLIFAATEAGFGVTEALRDAVDGPVAQEPVLRGAGQMGQYIKQLARYLGAHSAGITELKPYHVYSHIGRGSGTYGAEITLSHKFALAFSVEMDHRLVSTAPAAPTVLESARQYVTAAIIAIQLASLIRAQGYAARAHIDGNYRVVAPLVARDAGLGEIGRLGLLMTPGLGPRVRLGVVTTNLPLIPDRRGADPTVIDFCQICKKCAANCPVQAIPYGDREEIEGALRWRIKSDICYRYWCVIGTDCARCMSVCPYSHSDNGFHNAARWAVSKSGLARRAMLLLDDVFYGASPTPKPPPRWVPPASTQR